jgi:hypothetical protein
VGGEFDVESSRMVNMGFKSPENGTIVGKHEWGVVVAVKLQSRG